VSQAMQRSSTNRSPGAFAARLRTARATSRT
jgi:hypothetical protein